MRSLLNRLTPVFLTCALLPVAGCWRSASKASTYPVHGKVTWHGEPVRFAIVHFQPDGSGLNADAFTDNDGSYSLRTYSNEEPDGAAPGQYQVVLESYDDSDGGIPVPKGQQPTKFTGALNGPNSVEVTSGDNEVNIDIP
jgi:hypothetical protein